ADVGIATATNAGDDATFRSAFANTTETQINLTADITMNCGSGTFSRLTGSPLVVEGNGFKIDATGCNTQVIDQSGTGDLTLQDITITGGSYSLAGGGLQSNGNTTIINSTISGNTVTSTGLVGNVAGGGGIATTGTGKTLRITRSTVT